MRLLLITYHGVSKRFLIEGSYHEREKSMYHALAETSHWLLRREGGREGVGKKGEKDGRERRKDYKPLFDCWEIHSTIQPTDPVSTEEWTFQQTQEIREHISLQSSVAY